MLQGIYLLVFIICIIYIYYNFIKPTFNKLPKIPETFVATDDTSDATETLILNYYGDKKCPYSNTDSKAYNLIQSFEKDSKYTDVIIKYYWTDTDNMTFNKMQIEYVPTITNNASKKIDITVAPNTDITDRSLEELENLVKENIYAQLK